MNPMSRTVPSRQGKKQVIAFLRPNQIEAAVSKAERDHQTNQEVIGQALNAVFAKYGMPPLVITAHQRIVRRNKSRAQVRNDTTGPGCRAGRQALSGWFDLSVVTELQRFSAEVGMSVQAIVEEGVRLVTGVAPDEEAWVAVPDAAEATVDA